MSGSRIALTHASSLLAEAIIQKMVESGVSPDSVVLLDGAEGSDGRLAFGDTYLPVLDQYEFDFEGLSAVLLLQADDELQDLLQHAECHVLTHIGSTADDTIFVHGSDVALPEAPTRVQVASAELTTLYEVVAPINRLGDIEAVSVTNVLSASMFGKPGIDELAGQTIALLNSREVESAVFPMQIAFNMMPIDRGSHYPAQLAALLGQPGLSCTVHNLLAPAFHGLAIAVTLDLAEASDMQQLEKVLRGCPGLQLASQPVSPHTHCRKGFDIQVFGLASAQNDAKRLQFWIMADGIRNGLVKNYLNAIQVLPNSVL